LYLFAGAIACTADVYFALRWLNLSSLAHRIPRLRATIRSAQMVLDVSKSITRFRDRAAWRWRRRWNECLEQACMLLLCDAASEPDRFQRLRDVSSEFLAVRLPDALLKQ